MSVKLSEDVDWIEGLTTLPANRKGDDVTTR